MSNNMRFIILHHYFFFLTEQNAEAVCAKVSTSYDSTPSAAKLVIVSCMTLVSEIAEEFKCTLLWVCSHSVVDLLQWDHCPVVRL